MTLVLFDNLDLHNSLGHNDFFNAIFTVEIPFGNIKKKYFNSFIAF